MRFHQIRKENKSKQIIEYIKGKIKIYSTLKAIIKRKKKKVLHQTIGQQSN